MRPCLVCGRPTMGTKPRCGPHEREHERDRRRRLPHRVAYKDPAYVRFRTWVLQVRPACHLCGDAGADSVDHVVPLARGGDNQPSNLRPAHRACNYRKGAPQ